MPPQAPPLSPHYRASAGDDSARRFAPWWFVLGRTSLLSVAEVAALWRPPPAALLTGWFHDPAGSLWRVCFPLDPNKAMERLGGTIKIAEERATNLSETELLETIVTALGNQTATKKIIFGVSYYPGSAGLPLPGIKRGAKINGATPAAAQVARWGAEVKRRLKTTGRAVRFVFAGEPVLSSVSVTANALLKRGQEFLIFGVGEKKFSLALTRAVQPFGQWSEHDFGRPARDDRAGMLPPKLARILINLARLPAGGVLLDPFCGSGTILTEAFRLGYSHIIGADLSDQAIADTKQNLDWLRARLPAGTHLPSPVILQSDVRDISRKISGHSVHAIITEPTLGPPLTGRETPAQLTKNIEGLLPLYQAAFREFKKVLKPSGCVVCIIPRFQRGSRWLTLSDQLVAKIKKIGFVPEPLLPLVLHPEPFILYHRPGQRVGRELWKFQFIGH